MSNPRIWGKTMAELDEDHRKMLADRERAMTPQELGVKYALPRPIVLRQEPVRNFHFGTDIPAPTWKEIEDQRDRHGIDDAGHSGAWIVAAAFALPVAFVLALLYLIIK